MAGYADDWSMSNNALDAYARGLRPRSKWTKADILDALPADARAYLKLDEYPLEFLREYFLEVEEWHHTSKHYIRARSRILDLHAKRSTQARRRHQHPR